MKQNFNVATDGWIPVIDCNNVQSNVSLLQIFEHDYASFSLSEKETYCMIRLLEAIVLSCKKCQVNTIHEWKSVRPIMASEAISYIKEHIDDFYMEGDRPFLQCNESEIKEYLKNKSYKNEFKPIQLNSQYAVGNNAVINDMQISTYKSWSDVIIDLLVHQTFDFSFSPQKKLGAFFSPDYMPSNLPEGAKGKYNGNANIYLSCNTILDTIHANLNIGNIDYGTPVWETRFDTDTTSYLGQLIPLSKRILINSNLREMKYYPGLIYGNNISNNSHICHTDISAVTKTNKKTGSVKEIVSSYSRPIPVIQNMRIWKELAAFNMRKNKVVQLNEERLYFYKDAIINCIGDSIINKKGTYAIDYSINSMCSIPKNINVESYYKIYDKCVRLADLTSDKIKKAVRAINFVLTKNNVSFIKMNIDIIINQYWNFLDLHYNDLFNYCNDSDYDKWVSVIKIDIDSLLDYIGNTSGYLCEYKVSKIINSKEKKDAK